EEQAVGEGEEKEAQGAANTMKQKRDEEDKAQKERNAYALEMWKEEVKFWERERERAKEAHEKPQWNKPSRPKAEPPRPKPWTKRFKQVAATREDEGQDTDADSETEDDSDDDSDNNND
ncbi:hypothetical protein H0H87_002585, partial [Tephrocybe sp. NHM501043]